MNPITAPGLPSSVEVAGAEVRVRCGFRKQIALESLDLESRGGMMGALWLCYGTTLPDGSRSLPDVVAEHAAEAAEAAVAWHNGAWSLMRYGSVGSGAAGGATPRPVFDWGPDACIVASDFMRFYGIDLLDPSTQMHWYRFMAYFLPLTRAGGLVAQAVAARSPAPGQASKAERERRRQLARAWALPPTELELRESALRKF